MDSRADPGADPGFFFRGWGGSPGPMARIQDPHMGPIHTYVCIQTNIHTCACTDRHMNVHTQADGWTYMLKDRFFKICMIMYRDNVRNIHVRACRVIHERVVILKFPMKMNDLVPLRPTYFILIGYLKTGWGGISF